MEDISKYDNTLFGILQNEGQIEPFLEAIFNFLYRRTDFFKIQHDKSEKIGFPKGHAELIVKHVFLKFYQKALADDELLQRRLMETAVSEEIPYKFKSNSSSHQLGERKMARRRLPTKKSPETTQTAFQNCDSYNGATREQYCWSQTLKDVDVRVYVPLFVVSGKSVDVHITSDTLKISYLENENWQTILDDKLTNTINVEESMWTLVPGEHIHLNIEKTAKRWWTGLIVSEPCIDVTNIDVSMPFEDLDKEAQSDILEVVHNEEQKLQGKPTTEQMKMQNILKEAWNKEGSVFKGLPFDPTTVEIVNSSDTVSS